MGSPTGKKVIIVGAGAQGIVITGVLAAADDVAEIVLGDIDVGRAREIAETNGSPKIRVIELDATDLEAMTRVMKDGSFALVINATLPRFVHNVMKAAYAARTNYIDMASNEIYPTPEVPIEQLFYANDWKEAGLQCLTGGGGDPGLTNIMAKLAINEMDTVESIKIKDFGVVKCDEPVALWSMETFLEDVYLDSMIWEGGFGHKRPDPLVPQGIEHEVGVPHGGASISGASAVVIGLPPFRGVSAILNQSARFTSLSLDVGAPVYVRTTGSTNAVFRFSGNAGPVRIR